MEVFGFHIVHIFFAIIGMILGSSFPDIDLKISLISHRSIFTHSPLASGLMYHFAIKNNSMELLYFTIGFSLAVALHLIFDFFPKAWIGSALIKPSLNGITFSKYFLLTSTALLYYMSFSLMPTQKEFKLFLFLSIIFYLIMCKKEENKIKPLILLVSLYVFIGNLHYPEVFLGFFDTIDIIVISIYNYIF